MNREMLPPGGESHNWFLSLADFGGLVVIQNAISPAKAVKKSVVPGRLHPCPSQS